jgi:hypothetical protein
MLIFIVNLEEMQSAALLLGGSVISFKLGTWYFLKIGVQHLYVDNHSGN